MEVQQQNENSSQFEISYDIGILRKQHKLEDPLVDGKIIDQNFSRLNEEGNQVKENDCCVCLDFAYQDPQECKNCENLFCGTCIKTMREKKSSKCPTCKVDTQQFAFVKQVPRYRKLHILATKFFHKCTLDQKEEEIFTLETLQKHIAEECVSNQCLQCECCQNEQQYHLKDLVTHLEDECPCTPYLCKTCELIVDRKFQKEHDCMKAMKLLLTDAKAVGYKVDKRVYQEGFKSNPQTMLGDKDNLTQKILTLVNKRMDIIKVDQTQALTQIVCLKLYSFSQYMVDIKFQGFVKWITLSRVVKDLHPQKISLYDLVKYNNQNRMDDPVYKNLLSSYQDRFLNLTPTEDKSIHMKFDEYKDLSKKAVQLTFLFKHMKPESIQDLLAVTSNFMTNIVRLKQKYSQYARISDWDQLCLDLLQVFLIKLIINVIFKFESDQQADKEDVMKCGQFLALVAHSNLDPRKIFHRQILQVLIWVGNHYKNKKDKNAQKHFKDLEEKLSKNKFKANELIKFDPNQMPAVIEQGYQKIDQINLFEFVDEVDQQSCAYEFRSNFNRFKQDFQGEIRIHTIFKTKNNTLTEREFKDLLQTNSIQISDYQRAIFTENFDFNQIIIH